MYYFLFCIENPNIACNTILFTDISTVPDGTVAKSLDFLELNNNILVFKYPVENCYFYQYPVN